MAEDDLPKDSAPEIIAQVRNAMGQDEYRSPTLAAVVEASARLVLVDRKAREIVYDASAFILGLLLAGKTQIDSKAKDGNTATWFTDWLTPKVGWQTVRAAQARLEPRSFGADAGLSG